MVNLFRRIDGEQGLLPPALLALMVPAERPLLNGLLHLASLDLQFPKDGAIKTELQGAPAQGMVTAPDISLAVVALAPGEPLGLATPVGPTLVVSPTGKAPQGAHGLSWEQVDRWLATEEEQYDHESRTGFLVRQFRAFLLEVGISYFAGFPAELLKAAPDALKTLNQFYQDTARCFDSLAPALPGSLAQVREARAEDLLAGYSYRDYAGAPLGPTSFLRVAFHLPSGEVQLSFWLPAPRLQEVLTQDDDLLMRLRSMEERPFVWLWSTDGEQRVPLDEITPESLLEAKAGWAPYQAGVQHSFPLRQVEMEGLIARLAEQLEALVTLLAPPTTSLLH
jgi:hypothetical protein